MVLRKQTSDLNMYFQLAKAASKLSTHFKHHIGAVIVNKKPVSIGANLSKTHPVFATEENGVYSIHAEVKAIISCPRSKLEGAEMWVYREKADGSVGLAMPCEFCQAIIVEAGIKRVYYTDDVSPEGYGIMEIG